MKLRRIYNVPFLFLAVVGSGQTGRAEAQDPKVALPSIHDGKASERTSRPADSSNKKPITSAAELDLLERDPNAKAQPFQILEGYYMVEAVVLNGQNVKAPFLLVGNKRYRIRLKDDKDGLATRNILRTFMENHTIFTMKGKVREGEDPSVFIEGILERKSSAILKTQFPNWGLCYYGYYNVTNNTWENPPPCIPGKSSNSMGLWLYDWIPEENVIATELTRSIDKGPPPADPLAGDRDRYFKTRPPSLEPN